MSLNLFFCAFTQPQLDEMANNNALIEQWVLNDKNYAFKIDVGAAWEVLSAILGGLGIDPQGKHQNRVLFHGCTLITADTVKKHAEHLIQWTAEEVLQGLRDLDNEDLYWLEFFQEREDDLLKEFDKLVEFYQQASEQNLAALSYSA
jgi:hypothetical protein